MRFTTKLLPARSGNLGVLVLNNPKPFHALSLDMIHALQDTLQWWKQDRGMKAILLKSNKESKRPAFCAGGDVKSIYQSLLSDPAGTVHGQGVPGLASAEFFRQEYIVDHALATQAGGGKPQISFWDGIVMGGGVGISIHSKYRVATEHTVFAMPETAIGLFPDVGSCYWMPRLLSDGVAVYLALTGQRLKARDLLHCGIATHYVPSAKLDDLEKALITATESLQPTPTMEDPLDDVIKSFGDSSEEKRDSDAELQKAASGKAFGAEPAASKSLAKQESLLEQHEAAIEQVFGPALKNTSHTVEAICESLAALDDEFGRSTLAALKKMSPTSLKVTLEGLRRGAQQPTLEADLAMEFRMSQHFMRQGSDFREGIRAALVDKDGNPQWNPSTLAEVTDEMVQSYFAPIDHEWELPREESSSDDASSKL
eukprot:scaffold8058_cov158-Amphora_coffeaeformis.AAC.1